MELRGSESARCERESAGLERQLQLVRAKRKALQGGLQQRSYSSVSIQLHKVGSAARRASPVCGRHRQCAGIEGARALCGQAVCGTTKRRAAMPQVDFERESRQAAARHQQLVQDAERAVLEFEEQQAGGDTAYKVR
jgi:hypothetical protein